MFNTSFQWDEKKSKIFSPISHSLNSETPDELSSQFEKKKKIANASFPLKSITFSIRIDQVNQNIHLQDENCKHDNDDDSITFILCYQ